MNPLEEFMYRQGYTKEEIEIVRKAYLYAEKMHDKQLRLSGEPYIIHPLNVAMILVEMHVDVDTICAGLLHDTLEDTKATKLELVSEFNISVANLVDGVTKLAKMNFSSVEAANLANIRKIITGITEDIRIIIIKLADRLHNMRTLQYQKREKQREIAYETMQLYAPLAHRIGAYHIKNELEDLSLKYLKPEEYQKTLEQYVEIQEESRPCLYEMLNKIHDALNDQEIPNTIKTRIKNVYGIYKYESQGKKISEIHDLLVIKVIVEMVDECYRALGHIHRMYHPLNERFKDYICNPKTNLYQSLHTTVFGEDERLVQAQIRTYDMNRIASYGLVAYWDSKEEIRKNLQSKLREKYQFLPSLVELDKMFGDNKEFVTQVGHELFSDSVFVYTTKGEVIELPKGSTPIDFAYKIHTDVGNQMIRAIVNDEYVPFNYQLKDYDRVKIITANRNNKPDPIWEEWAKTSYAKKKVRDYYRKQNG